MLTFHDLNEDVVLRVLSFCDVYTVLTFSTLNRHSHSLTQSTTLWLALAANLGAYFSDAKIAALRRLPRNGIIEELKKLVCGPAAISGDLTLTEHSLPDPTGAVDGWTKCKVLPGGEFIMLDNIDALTCVWRQTGEIVWRKATLCLWAYEMDQDSAGDIHLAVLTIGDGGANPYMTVVHLQRSSGQARVTFSSDVPMRRTDPIHAVAIHGSYVGALWEDGPLRIGGAIITNWVTRKWLAVELDAPRSTPSMRILPGHFIFLSAAMKANQQGSYEDILHVYPISRFDGLWKPTHQEWKSHPLSSFRPLLFERLIHNGVCYGDQGDMTMRMHPNPLRDGGYRLTLSAWENMYPPSEHEPHEWFCASFTYHFSIDHTGSLSLTHKSVRPADSTFHKMSTSYAGFLLMKQPGAPRHARLANRHLPQEDDVQS
ncbi:unnamed protein product, partial [Mycena citricolor]